MDDTKNKKKEGVLALWAGFSPIIRFSLIMAVFILGTFFWIAAEEALGIAVHHSAHKPKILGFWGDVTANVDWCEDNYVTTHYIAEFWNALSSLWFVLVGLICYFNEMDVFKSSESETPFLLCYLSSIVIGFGSMLFHGTLKWSMQTLDELPMVYGALAFIYVLETLEDLPNKQLSPKSLPQILMAVGVFGTFVELFFPSHPELFQILFVSQFLYMLYRGFVMYGKCTRKEEKTTVEYGLACFVFGSFCWVVEPFLCNRFGWAQLHSWWHIFSGLGLYYFISFTQLYRARVLEYRHRL